MFEQIRKIIQQYNILSHHNQGILIARVQDTHQGFNLAKNILYAVCDKKTILYLSGGRTPKDLYKKLAEEEQLEVEAVGLIDERFGAKFHDNSNEKMLRDTGLLRYLQMRDIKFYPILHSSFRHSRPSVIPAEAGIRVNSSGNPKESWIPDQVGDDSLRKQAAMEYDKTVRELLNAYQKSIGVLGVGLDGHTAGLPALSSKFPPKADQPLADKMQSSKLYEEDYSLVTEYDDTSGVYGERITMTFLGLSMLDLNIVLVFGDDKKEALEKMFADGSEEDVPSRFFKRPEIAQKTLLITDQNV